MASKKIGNKIVERGREYVNLQESSGQVVPARSHMDTCPFIKPSPRTEPDSRTQCSASGQLPFAGCFIYFDLHLQSFLTATKLAR